MSPTEHCSESPPSILLLVRPSSVYSSPSLLLSCTDWMSSTSDNSHRIIAKLSVTKKFSVVTSKVIATRQLRIIHMCEYLVWTNTVYSLFRLRKHMGKVKNWCFVYALRAHISSCSCSITSRCVGIGKECKAKTQLQLSSHCLLNAKWKESQCRNKNRF